MGTMNLCSAANPWCLYLCLLILGRLRTHVKSVTLYINLCVCGPISIHLSCLAGRYLSYRLDESCLWVIGSLPWSRDGAHRAVECSNPTYLLLALLSTKTIRERDIFFCQSVQSCKWHSASGVSTAPRFWRYSVYRH